MNTATNEDVENPARAEAMACDPRWAAVERIAASQNFVKSVRLNSFLLHAVRCTIEGRTEELTEQQIGVQVFGRSPGYNPSEDNIVRTTARQLRQRLALYYQEEGSADSVHIRVPRGGYIPVFQFDETLPPCLPEEAATPEPVPAAAATAPATAPATEEAAPAKAPARFRALWQYAAALLIGAVLAVLIYRAVFERHPVTSAANPLWAEIFSPGQTTLFVPGDAGLNLYNLHSGREQPLSLSEYINSKVPPLEMENLATKEVYPDGLRAYIPISDLTLAHQLTMVSAARGKGYEIHYAQSLSADSFRDANVILSGAPPYNPWVEMFDDKLNFHFVFNGLDHSIRVVNRHPQKGEQPAYMFEQDPNHELGYGYLALTDNPEGSGKVFLIEGTSLVGVDAAVSFLFDEKKIAPIIARAKAGKGRLANFEVLLEAPFFNINAGDTKVVAARYYTNN